MCLSGRAESWLATLFMAKNRQMVNWLGLSSAEQLVDKHHSIHFTNWALSIFIQLRCPFWSRPQKLLSAFVGILSEVMGIGVWFSDQICTASKEFRIAPPRNCDIRWRVKGWGAHWCRDKIFDKRYHRSLHVKQHSCASSRMMILRFRDMNVIWFLLLGASHFQTKTLIRMISWDIAT